MKLLPDAVFLLGAGASKDAGVPTSFELTKEISEQFNATGPHGYDPPGWREQAAALNFVCATLMVSDAVEQGSSPYDSLDVERVFAAIRLLAERRSLEVSPFVASWHPAVDALDVTSELDSSLDRGLTEAFVGFNPIIGPHPGAALQAVERVIDAHERRARGDMYRALANRMVIVLRELISTNAKELDYLHPLVRLGAGQRRVVIATLNYDRSIELAAGSAGVACDTG